MLIPEHSAPSIQKPNTPKLIPSCLPSVISFIIGAERMETRSKANAEKRSVLSTVMGFKTILPCKKELNER